MVDAPKIEQSFLIILRDKAKQLSILAGCSIVMWILGRGMTEDDWLGIASASIAVIVFIIYTLADLNTRKKLRDVWNYLFDSNKKFTVHIEELKKEFDSQIQIVESERDNFVLLSDELAFRMSELVKLRIREAERLKRLHGLDIRVNPAISNNKSDKSDKKE